MAMAKMESPAEPVLQAAIQGISTMFADKNMFQLIEEDGTFNGHGLNAFATKMKLEEIGLDYAVVSVIGPQSSGKSTLLNHLFKTEFKEMEASERNGSRTTQGIWLAKASGFNPSILVMDIEGSDGKERGEDGTLFQNQSAIFALMVSNVVIINISSKEIGHVGGWTNLLKTIFKQTINLKLQSRTILWFVARDRSPHWRPLSLIKELQKQIEEIWSFSVPKTQGQEDASLHKFFDVQINSLPHFEHSRESFNEEVSSLRAELYRCHLPRIIEEQKNRVPASAISCKSQTSWEIIKQNRDLDIPSVEKLVSTYCCHQLKKEIANSFCETKDWKDLKKAVASGLVPNFGQKLSSVIGKSLLDYDQKAAYYDEVVRNETRLELIGDLKQLEIGEPFDAAAENCKRDIILSFDSRCEDMENEYTKYNLTDLHGRLNRDISHCIELVSVQITAAHSRATSLDTARAAAEANAKADEAAAEAAVAAEAAHTALVTRGDSTVALQRAADARVASDQAARTARRLNDRADEAAAVEERDAETLRQWVDKMVKMGLSFILSLVGIFATARSTQGAQVHTGSSSVSTTTIINPVYNIVQLHSDRKE